jgi:hypothetical protein
MCSNLRNILDNLKLSDKPACLQIMDIVIVPNNLSADEVEMVLGINAY